MGAKALNLAKWNELADIIMQKRHLYSCDRIRLHGIRFPDT